MSLFIILLLYIHKICYRCYSYVGRLYSAYQPQGVSLGRGCVFISTAIHELGHAIGFYHEHTRSDRDEYVNVLTNNIRSGQESNFRKFQPGATLTFGYGYDYASIMHYRSNSFSRNRESTIVAKDSGIVFGSTKELSPLDILKANALYSCCKCIIINIFSFHLYVIINTQHQDQHLLSAQFHKVLNLLHFLMRLHVVE